MEPIITSMATGGDVLTAVYGLITANALLSFVAAVGLIKMGFGLFKGGKRAAR